MAEIVVLLGSNINPAQNIRKAVRLLRRLFDVRAVSTAWQTTAVDSDGPDFINLVVLIQAETSAEQLKAECLRQMEHRMGRVRTGNKNAPRTIDLDVILFDRQVIDRGLWSYPHIAVPIAELLPDLIEPVSGISLVEISRNMIGTGGVMPRPDILFN